MMPTDQDYLKLLTEVVQRQIAILGPSITFAKLRGIDGIKINDDGSISQVWGDRSEIEKKIFDRFGELGESLSEVVLKDLKKDAEAAKTAEAAKIVN